MRVQELRRLAEANGVASRFRLANGRWNEVRPETLEAVLAAMGVDPGAAAHGVWSAGAGSHARPAGDRRAKGPRDRLGSSGGFAGGAGVRGGAGGAGAAPW